MSPLNFFISNSGRGDDPPPGFSKFTGWKRRRKRQTSFSLKWIFDEVYIEYICTGIILGYLNPFPTQPREPREPSEAGL